MMSVQLDKLPKEKQKRVEESGLYLSLARTEERGRNRAKIRNLNDQGGRHIANIASRNSGLCSEDAPPDQAGGPLRLTYL